jgi:hypothetical protein
MDMSLCCVLCQRQVSLGVLGGLTFATDSRRLYKQARLYPFRSYALVKSRLIPPSSLPSSSSSTRIFYNAIRLLHSSGCVGRVPKEQELEPLLSTLLLTLPLPSRRNTTGCLLCDIPRGVVHRDKVRDDLSFATKGYGALYAA